MKPSTKLLLEEADELESGLSQRISWRCCWEETVWYARYILPVAICNLIVVGLALWRFLCSWLWWS